jgi:rRNA maturation endonuclease Nob1
MIFSYAMQGGNGVRLYCVGCGEHVRECPCPTCGHKYVVLIPTEVQLRLFYERANAKS